MNVRPLIARDSKDIERAQRKLARCAFCSMGAEFVCDWPGCRTMFCKRDGVETDGGHFCREHKPGIK